MGLLKVLGLSPAPLAPTGPAVSGTAESTAWPTARKAALAQLRALGEAIKGTGDPAGQALLVLLLAMGKNIAPTLRNRQHADELERYLRDDELLADAETRNPFGVVVDVRRPLLEALTLSRPYLPD